jgi:hypothetical protein
VWASLEGLEKALPEGSEEQEAYLVYPEGLEKASLEEQEAYLEKASPEVFQG